MSVLDWLSPLQIARYSGNSVDSSVDTIDRSTMAVLAVTTVEELAGNRGTTDTWLYSVGV